MMAKSKKTRITAINYLLLVLAFLAYPMVQHAQTLTPEVTSWIINVSGATGYGGYATNVQEVQYSDDNVYITCTCIPGYDIGPWAGNPNTPSNQNFCFKITRNPIENTGVKIETSLGHIGVWSNGVSIFNASDAASYNNQGIWNQNAIFVEGSSFDDCLGHPAPNGEYHHHLNPTCLYDDTDNTSHSPIIGYGFDGFPIYGAFGYSNPDGTGGIRRMESSYQLRTITDRTSLPDGTSLQPSQYGPAIGASITIGPGFSLNADLGFYMEDFEYIQGSGDLDEHNGKDCVTPEYLNGTYAYFVTIDASGDAAYPYTIGPEYYGTVQNGNIGPGSGHNVPTETVETYTPSVTTLAEKTHKNEIIVFPNPATSYFQINTDAKSFNMSMHDINGRIVGTITNVENGEQIPIYFLNNGIYFLEITNTSSNNILGHQLLHVSHQ